MDYSIKQLNNPNRLVREDAMGILIELACFDNDPNWKGDQIGLTIRAMMIRQSV